MGNVFDQMANTPQSNQPVAQKPPVDIPQPIQDVRTTGNTTGNIGGIPFSGTASISAVQGAVGVAPNAFDKMAAQAPPTPQTVAQNQTVPEKTEDEQQSDTMRYLHKLWNSAGEFVGEHVPQAATGPLAFATHKVIEPYNQSMAWATKTAGELAEKAAVFGTPLTVEQAREKFPRTMGLTAGVSEAVGGLVADPRNWPLMAGKFAKPILNRLMSGAFAGQMGAGTKEQAEELAKNWDNMSPYERWKNGTELGLGAAMTVGAASHAGFGEKGVIPAPEKGTEAGPRTAIRPTTVKTAGVEAPIPANKQIAPNAFTKMASEVLSTPGDASEFQNVETKPAATRQMVSALSQSATDKIAAHDALVKGEPVPVPIAGTQVAGEHTHPEQIWPAMQKSAEQTWAKARIASSQDLSQWQQEYDAAAKVLRDNIDRHNAAVESYNADPANKDNPLEPVQFNPEDVDVREKPKTYDELKADLDNAKERAADNATDVRQKARDVEIPKAQKALDAWFKEHEDLVSKPEYDSAQKLWADSERFKEIDRYLSRKLATGNLTANDIRGLEPSIDNRAKNRRGQAGVGEFRNLLGPETYTNLQTIAKLFEPFEKTSPLHLIKSWGLYTLKGLAAGLLGTHEAGLGLGGVTGLGVDYLFHKIAKSVLFNPEFGQSFSRLVEATKNAYTTGKAVSADVLSNMKAKVLDLLKSERGEAEIPGTGRMGTVGEPAKATFDFTDNGKDDEGNPNFILGIKHEGDHIGHLNISQKTPDSWTVNDASVRANMQGRGFGTQGYEHAFQQAADRGIKFVESDISTSKAAAKTWRRLMEKYPDAITEENGQFTADVAKIHTQAEPAPAVSSQAVEHIQSGQPFAIMTAENPMNTKATPEANAKANESLLRDLKEKGYNPTPVVGQEGDLGRSDSFFIPNIKPEDAFELGKKYKQAQILTQEGLHDIQKNTVNPADYGNMKLDAEARKEAYHSTIGDRSFSVPIDFDKEVAPQTPEMAAASADFAVEKSFANKLLKGEAKIGDFPYYDSYKRTIDAESKLLPPGAKVLFIGGGPVPLSSILLSENGFHVDTMELLPEAARMGEQVAEKVGAKTGKFITGDARTFENYGDYDGIILALEAGPEAESKNAALQNIMSQARPDARILARGTAGAGGESFVDTAKSLPEGTGIAQSIDTFDGLSKTHVLEPTTSDASFNFGENERPEVAGTTARPVGSTVGLMSNPLKITPESGDTPVTTDVAKALNEFTTEKLPAYQLGEAPTEAMVARAKELAEDEARYQLAQNNSGTAWYTEQMDEHDAIAQEMRPELKNDTNLSLFKYAEAILSSGQKPYRNFKAAMEAWDIFHDQGKFSRVNPETKKSWGPRGVDAYGNAFDMLNRLVAEKGKKGAVKWLQEEHPVSELKQYNKWISGKKTDLRPGSIILGEKRGPFSQNLHKQESAFTADMWVSRTWNRWMGTLEADPMSDKGELLSDSPRNDTERNLMKQSFSDVATKLGLTTSSLQAVLWYYEQALYTAHGTPKESWSFSDAAKRAQAEDLGPRPGKGKAKTGALPAAKRKL